MLISGTALLLACTVFICYDQITYKEVMKQKLNTLAEIIGNHCTAALIFDNEEDAQETLAILLKAEKNILFAAIYDQDEKLFAKYKLTDSDTQSLPPVPDEDGCYFKTNYLVLFRQIFLDNKRIGKVYIQSNLGEIRSRMKRFIFIIVLVLSISAVTSFLMTARLQRFVSEPVLHLANIAKMVSLKKDYTIRAEKTSEDELGFLTERFNEMLGQIHEQNIALTRAQNELKDRAKQLQNELTERKKAEKIIKASLEEKDILLKEIHHRVKNNLQVISSLLYLQSQKVREKETFEMFNESQNRVKSMALIHEKLYQSKDFMNIDFSEYIKNLTSHLFESYKTNSGKIDIHINVENVSLSIDKAIPCGLIINELVSNSLKYAFTNDQMGKIDINLNSTNQNEIKMVVEDNGVGVPDDIELKDAKTLGLRLVSMLTEQLNGTIDLHRNKGTQFTIVFQA